MMTFEELTDFLDSDANEHGLDSYATHGFLCATVVGKPLPNWVEALFDGHSKQVPPNVVAALTQWRDDILADLQDEKPIELPFFDEDETEIDLSPSSDISAWCVGFVDAMYAEEAEDWFSDPEQEEDVAMLTLPMVALSRIDEAMDEADESLVELRADEDTLLDMANSIEENLTELYLLFHTQD